MSGLKESSLFVPHPQAGIAIKPNTEVEVISEYIPEVDMVLVMTVEPGYGGQAFMTPMLDKVRKVRQMAPLLDIQVDGGVGPKTIDCCSDVSQPISFIKTCWPRIQGLP